MDRFAVARLGAAFSAVDPDFPRQRFLRLAGKGLDGLELKARMAQVAAALQDCLPEDFSAAAGIVERVVDGASTQQVDADGGSGSASTDSPDLGTWELWPVNDWVALAGRNDPEQALHLLARITSLSSAEFAVRPFIDDDPARTLAALRPWARNDDEHVRRLVSEGTRPRLPWATRLKVAATDPGFAVGLLDQLAADPSEYVRRSVSNHLNDLCRCDRDLGLRWPADGTSARGRGLLRSRTRRIVATPVGGAAEGLRSLVKEGDPDALHLLGHDPEVDVEVVDFDVEPREVTLGGHARLHAVAALPRTERPTRSSWTTPSASRGPMAEQDGRSSSGPRRASKPATPPS